MSSGWTRVLGKNHFRIDHILRQSEEGTTLDPLAVAHLLNQENPLVQKEVGLVARLVKERRFGTRIALFAPLYLSNDCTNNCLYCGFRRGNRSVVRRTLTVQEAVNEARVLAARGFRRILLVAAENPKTVSVRYLCQVTKAILEETSIGTITVNAAPMPTEGFLALRESGALAYQCFQETYLPDRYSQMHPWGKKREYAWRLGALDRAIEGGFAQIGMGVLLGLWNFRFDIMAMIAHAQNLLSRQGNVEVVLSLPRFRSVAGAALSEPPSRVNDNEFAYAVAVCRLALPSAEIAISTRECPEFRDGLMERGASMMSAGSVTWPGGYTAEFGSQATGQFTIEDTRSVEQVSAALVARGLTPIY